MAATKVAILRLSELSNYAAKRGLTSFRILRRTIANSCRSSFSGVIVINMKLQSASKTNGSESRENEWQKLEFLTRRKARVSWLLQNLFGVVMQMYKYKCTI